MHIIFDVGRVLCKVNLDIFVKEFDRVIGPRINNKIDGMDFLSSIQTLQDAGKTTVELSLIDLCGGKINYLVNDSYPHNRILDSVVAAWKRTISPYTQMVEFKNWLIENGHEVAILSNMGHEHKRYIIENYPEIFRGCATCFSCDINYRKPSKICFYLFLKKYPEFENALYFDDLQDNLETGESFGLNPYHIDLEEIYLYSDDDKQAEETIYKQISSIKAYISEKI